MSRTLRIGRLPMISVILRIPNIQIIVILRIPNIQIYVQIKEISDTKDVFDTF